MTPDLGKINKYSAAEARDNRRAAGLPLGGGLDATDGMGPVPEKNVARYTRLGPLHPAPGAVPPYEQDGQHGLGPEGVR